MDINYLLWYALLQKSLQTNIILTDQPIVSAVETSNCFTKFMLLIKVRKRAKIRNRYNQAPHLTSPVLVP